MAVRDKIGGGFRRLPASNEAPRSLIIFSHMLIYKCFCNYSERCRFATEPVVCSFLMILEVLARLTSKPSFFNDLNIPAGWRPCL